MSSRRREYLHWIEEQIEGYKERVSRTELLEVADEVVAELRVNSRGQYQLTEVLLSEAVDRKIFRMLRLPSYRGWVESLAEREQGGEEEDDDEGDDPVPLPEAASF